MRTLKICTGKNCSEKFANYIKIRLENDKKFYHFEEDISIVETPCMGNCEHGPNIKIDDEIFEKQNPVKSSEILRKKVEEWKSLQKKF